MNSIQAREVTWQREKRRCSRQACTLRSFPTQRTIQPSQKSRSERTKEAAPPFAQDSFSAKPEMSHPTVDHFSFPMENGLNIFSCGRHCVGLCALVSNYWAPTANDPTQTFCNTAILLLERVLNSVESALQIHSKRVHFLFFWDCYPMAPTN